MADEQAIRTVINEQFGAEVVYKESELQRIDDRIQLAKMMLHRLRLGILAQQYGLSGFYLVEDYSRENIGVQVSWKSFESEFLNSQPEEDKQQKEKGKEEMGDVEGREVERRESSAASGDKQEGSTPDLLEGAASGSSVQSSRVPSEAGEEDVGSTADPRQPPDVAVGRKLSSLLNDLRKYSPSANSTASSTASTAATGNVERRGGTRNTVCEDAPSGPDSPSLPASLSRHATKKRVIVGNTSQFLDPNARSTIDGSTHKWMVYVRGPSKEADISSFVKAVRFFLHPSYHPNDIIRISKPPFHLTRYGWGEFPVRVQLEFTDKCNKHVDIIHNLVLDRTHTGHQTLGSETVVDLDLVTTDSPAPATGESGGDGRGAPRSSSMHPFSASINNVKRGEKHKSGREPEMTAESGGDSRHIHHVFLPASSTVDQVLLDHNYAQITVVSRRPRPLPSTTADEAMDTCDLEGRTERQTIETDEDTLLDEFLHSMVKTVPLCGPESNGFHLVAPSIEHFRKWNIGRRRASEWMRALAMKRLIQSLDPPVPAATSLSTRRVMEWCRRNGYTPLDPVPRSSRGFCKYCGCQLSSCWEETDRSEGNSHTRCSDKMELLMEEDRGQQEVRGEDSSDSDSEPMEEEEGDHHGKPTGQAAAMTNIRQHFSTLSDPFQLFESLATQTRRIQALREQQAGEQVVDVLSLPPQRHPAIEAVPRFRVPQTPELKWVQRTAAAIGIRIFPAVIDRMYAHVVEHMIYMACTKFARVIMDRAVTESARQVEGDSSNEERCIVPLHIYRAVESLECCDFLTNAYVGLPQTEEPPSTTDRDRTLREE